MNEVKLQKGRERSVLRRHPWIFSGAIQGEGLETGLESACRRDGDGTGLAELFAQRHHFVGFEVAAFRLAVLAPLVVEPLGATDRALHDRTGGE